MTNLSRFRTEVTLIVNSLAKAVVAEIFTAAENVFLNSHKPEAEEKLGSVVDNLCVEAVSKILKICPLTTENQDQYVGETPLPSDDTCEELTTQAAGDENRCSFSGATGDLMKDRPSSCPPPQTGDHDYVRPSSSPPPPHGKVRRDCSRRRKKMVEVSVETHLQCAQCSMMFPNAERLADHEKKSHPLCSVCGVAFTGIMKLREHEIKVHGLLPYTCSYCPKTFNHKAHRDLHVKARHTGEKSCHCDICGRGFSCISVLKMHRLIHFDKTFVCDICGKAFYHACHLTRHKLVHKEVRPFTCSTCGRGFTQAANLRSHHATHTGEKQLCSICGKSFRCLKNHIISKHSHELPAGELPAADTIISCNICRKKFPNPSQYRAHQHSHTRDKLFHSHMCGKTTTHPKQTQNTGQKTAS